MVATNLFPPLPCKDRGEYQIRQQHHCPQPNKTSEEYTGAVAIDIHNSVQHMCAGTYYTCNTRLHRPTGHRLTLQYWTDRHTTLEYTRTCMGGVMLCNEWGGALCVLAPLVHKVQPMRWQQKSSSASEWCDGRCRCVLHEVGTTRANEK